MRIFDIDKVKNLLGDVVYNHINSLNREQLEAQLVKLRADVASCSQMYDDKTRESRKAEIVLIKHKLA